MSVRICREVAEDGPGSSQLCPATGQEAMAETDVQEVPPENEGELLHSV